MYEPSDEPYHITLEIENRRCKGLKMLKDLGVQQYMLNDIRSLPEGTTRHLLRIPSKKIAEIPKNTFTKIRGSREKEEKTSAWFDSDGCDVCRTILSQNSFLLSGRHVEGHTIIYSFVAPNFDAFQKIMSALEAGGLEPKPLEVTKFKRKENTLTEKQERVLWLALKMGFFDFPRKINMLDLSRRLGVGLSTLSEITRRGTRRLLEHHFES